MTFIRLALGLWTWAIVGVLCLGGLATLVAPGGIVRPSPVHPVYPPNLAISGKVIGSRGGVPRDLRVLVWGEDAFGRYGGESVPLTGDDEFVASRLA